MRQLKVVRADSKGRITLGPLARGIDSFSVSYDDQDRIILEPLVEVPARELWLFKNKTALEQVKNGLKDSVEGRIKLRDSFAKFKDDKID